MNPLGEDSAADIQRGLGRLEGKMDLLLSNIHTHIVEDTARFQTIGDRLDGLSKRQGILEKKIYTFFGGIAVIWAGVQIWSGKIAKLLGF